MSNMDRDQDIDATYSGGVLRPDQPLPLPENSRVRVTVHDHLENGTHAGPTRIDPSPAAANKARQAWSRYSQQGVLTLGGTRPTRDQMHERG